VAGDVARREGVSFARRLAVILVTVAAFLWGVTAQFRSEHYDVGPTLFFEPMAVFAGGHQLPLGLLTGGIAAYAAAKLVRVPWGIVGDSLAIGACVMIAIGRIGCLVNGCCTGVICDGSWSSLCLRHGRGSEPHGLQLAARLIAPGDTLSLPVHPLPLYFMATASALLAGLLVLRRRHARTGLIGALFMLVYPATQLFLEFFRASTGGAPAGLRLTIPALTIVVGMVLVWLTLRAAPPDTQSTASAR
jgi:phosphatidylglycerol:prolipoprotein diacylglycerol transferase